MTTNLFKISASLFLLFLFVMSGCKPNDWVESRGSGPTMSIAKEFEKIEGINVGDKVSIPINIKSPSGIKRFSYYFVTETANGTVSGTPVHLDRTDYPTELNQNLEFTVVPSIVEIVLVSFDKDNNSSELHINMSDIRALPVLTFRDNIKYQETVFRDRHFHVRGTVTSQHDLESVTYKTIVNNVVGSDQGSVPITNKRELPFDIDILVPEGLNAVIVTAKNIYNGMVVDTFKVGGVAEDAVNITLAGSITSIPNVYIDSANRITGEIISGSDIRSVTYALKVNGVYGPEQTIPINAPLTTFPLNFTFDAVNGMQGIRITAINESDLQSFVELPVHKVNRRLLRFRDIVLTTEIGPGKNNWFSAWKAPHVFDVTNAAANQEWIDFGTIIYNGAFRFVPPFIYTAGTAYFNASAPYMVGFSKATYTMITANRRSVTTAALDTLLWDVNMDNFININIKGPGPLGENYNVSTTNRRVSGDPVPGTGIVIGWGSWNLATSAVNNQDFGVVLVKSYDNQGAGKGTVVLDIVLPAENMRAKYNPVSMFGYPTP